MEKYITVDLERHVGLGLCRSPYYLSRTHDHLDKVQAMLNPEAEGHNEKKHIDHLVAELQLMCVEYGFCSSMEAIYDTDEAELRLQQLSTRMQKLETTISSQDPSLILVELHNIIASLNGIQQAMTPANIAKMQKKFSALEERILKVENNLSSDNIRADSELFMKYLACHHLLKRPFLQAFHKVDPMEVINDHVIHPGTRGWILDRISRWVCKSQKKIYFLSGKQGAGKSALASAVCKLLNHSVIARHFFDVCHGSSLHNQTSGLVQSIAYDLCHVLPEYLNYLDDNLNEEAQSRIESSWESAYDVLLKKPLQALYGAGKGASSNAKRRLIVIDSLDEVTFSEWSNMKIFFQRFIKDFSSSFCILATVRTKHSGAFNIQDEDNIEVLQFENRAWQSWHIKDVEIYLSSSVGAILSGEDERGTPQHAKVDQKTLQNTMDELLKCSAGRFDYAITLIQSFANEMAAGGQFLGSVKKAMLPMKQSHGEECEEKIGSFASPYRAYRDKEGRSGLWEPHLTS